jgi:DNA-binding LacI/PurR family transcriptional regulator
MNKDFKKPTIKDIARISGFSHATVSRVLNNKGMFYSNETKEKILNAAKNLKYVPNKMAKYLKENKTNLIAYLTPTDHPFYFSILRGINDYAIKNGYNVSVLISYYDEEKEKINIDSLLSNQVIGVIISSMLINEEQLIKLNENNMPIVLIDREDKHENISNISINNREMAFKATDYLIKSGYKNIGFLSGPLKYLNFLKRFQGYKDGLEYNSIKFTESNVLILDDLYWLKDNLSKTYELLTEIIKKNMNLDAILSISSSLPILLLKILNNLNLKVPSDMAILSFSELPFSKYMTPPISAVIEPSYDMGYEAAKILLKMVDNRSYSKFIYLPSKIEIRGST